MIWDGFGVRRFGIGSFGGLVLEEREEIRKREMRVEFWVSGSGGRVGTEKVKGKKKEGGVWRGHVNRTWRAGEPGPGSLALDRFFFSDPVFDNFLRLFGHFFTFIKNLQNKIKSVKNLKKYE